MDKAIQDKFLPAVFGREMLSWEKELVKAAVKRGGLGIRCPTETAKDAYQMSAEGTAKMVEAVRQGTDLVEEEHNDQLREVRREMKARWEKEQEENVERLVADLPKRPKRALERVRKESGWLTVGPSKQYGFDLSKEMFRDRLNLRHGQELRGAALGV